MMLSPTQLAVCLRRQLRLSLVVGEWQGRCDFGFLTVGGCGVLEGQDILHKTAVPTSLRVYYSMPLAGNPLILLFEYGTIAMCYN